jgi:hypothetical protein
LHLDDAKSAPQLHELDTPERLHEDIGELFHSPDMFHLHLAFFYAFTNEMIFRIDMLTAIMMHRFLLRAIADMLSISNFTGVSFVPSTSAMRRLSHTP